MITKTVKGKVIFEAEDGQTWDVEFDQILQWLKSQELTREQCLNLVSLLTDIGKKEIKDDSTEIHVYVRLKNEMGEWSWYRHEPERKWLVFGELEYGIKMLGSSLKKDLNCDVMIKTLDGVNRFDTL